MSIVLNENKWAEQAINDGRFLEAPVETLNRIAKYYYSQSMTKKQVKQQLSEYVYSCDPSAPSTLWEPVIERAVKYAQKSPSISIKEIVITDKEFNTIHNLTGKQEQRLAFTLLCIAKFNNMVNSQNNYWVSTPDKEIMKMANINTSIKRQSKMFHDLRELGLLKFSKRVDSLSVQVLYADDSGSPQMSITDYRNLGFQYMSQSNNGFFICEKCGVVEKNKRADTGRPRKYCADCAKKVKHEQNVRALHRYRESLYITQ